MINILIFIFGIAVGGFAVLALCVIENNKLRQALEDILARLKKYECANCEDKNCSMCEIDEYKKIIRGALYENSRN